MATDSEGTRSGWLEDPIEEQEAMVVVEQMRARIRRYQTLATPEVALNVAVATSLNQSLSPEAITALAVVGGLPGESDMYGELAQREAEQGGTIGGSGGFLSEAGDFLRGAIRWGTLAFDGLYDEVIQRPLRVGAGMANKGFNLGEAYAASGDAPFGAFGEALSTAFSGEEVNLGTGFFAESRLAGSVEEKLAELDADSDALGRLGEYERNEIYQKYADEYGYIAPTFLSIPQQQMMLTSQVRDKIYTQANDVTTDLGQAQEGFGKILTQRQRAEEDAVIMSSYNVLSGKRSYSQVSPGRVFAGIISEPGTTPFHLISGGLDFAANIFLDPANFIGMGGAKLARGARTISLAEGGGKTGKALDGMRAVTKQADEAEASLKALSDTADYRRYKGWTPESRAKYDAAYTKDYVTPEMVGRGEASQDALNTQQSIARYREVEDLKGQLTDLENSPEMVEFYSMSEGLQVRSRGYSQRYPAGTGQRSGDLERVAGRIEGTETRMAGLRDEVDRLTDTDDYRRWKGWSKEEKQAAMVEASKRDVVRSDFKTKKGYDLAKDRQRVARNMVRTNEKILIQKAEVDELRSVATMKQQMRAQSGALMGTRVDSEPFQVSDWISGKAAQPFVRGLADGDLATVDRLLGKSGKPISNRLRAQLVAEKTEEGIVALLLPAMDSVSDTGIGIFRQMGIKGGFASPAGMFSAAVDARVGAKMGRLETKPLFASSRIKRALMEQSPNNIDFANLDEAYEGLLSFTGNLGLERGNPMLESYLERFVNLEKGDLDGAWDLIAGTDNTPGMMGDIFNSLIDDGMNEKVAKELTNVFRTSYEDGKFFVDRMGREVDGLGAKKTRVRLDGVETYGLGPQLLSETWKGVMNLPEASLVRRAAADLDVIGQTINKLTTKGAENLFSQRAILAATNRAITKAWKPLVLLRVAWPFKVIGEEQARMAASGLDTVFTNPMNFIAGFMSDRRLLDVNGNVLQDAVQFQASMARRTTFQGDYRSIGAETWQMITRAADGSTDKLYREGLVREWKQLWDDEVVTHLFRVGVKDQDRLAATTRWLRNDPEGQDILRRLKQHADDNVKTRLDTEAGVRSYVESVNARAHLKAGGNFERVMTDGSRYSSKTAGEVEKITNTGQIPARAKYVITEPGVDEILETYATGKWDGVAVRDVLTDGRKKELDALATRAMSRYEDKLPSTVKGLVAAGSEKVSGVERATNRMFELLMAKPTNYLSRSPAFSQFYWRKIGETSKFMDDATKAAVRQKMGANKQAARWFNEGAKVAPEQGGVLIRSLDEIDELAKGEALFKVQDLLFDVSKRRNISDAASIIAPFLDAWFEVMDTWRKIMVQQNIRPVRRMQQAVVGARESNIFNASSGWTNEGFLYENDFGQEVFATPFAIPGLDGAKFEYSPSQLFSIVGLPGLGPGVAMPLQPLLTDNPEWDFVREFVDPFGRNDLNSLLPSAYQRFFAAFDGTRGFINNPEMERAYQNALVDGFKQLVMEDEDRVAGMTRDQIDKEVKSMVRGRFLIESLARWVGPATPRTVPLIEDDTGKVWALTAMADEWYQMQERNDGDRNAAQAEFTSLFGFSPAILTTPKTIEVSPRSETLVGSQFQRANPELFTEYPDIAFYLGSPQLEDYGDFNYGVYAQNLAEGARKDLSYDEWLGMMNDSKGQLAMIAFKAEQEKQYGPLGDIEDSDLATEVSIDINNFSLELARRFPGFTQKFGNEPPGIPSRVSVEAQVAQFENLVVEHARFTQVPPGPDATSMQRATFAVSVYLRLFNAAQTASQADGLVSGVTLAGESDPTSAAYQRRGVLRREAARLIREYPEFGPIWQNVFARQLTDDNDRELTTEDAYALLGVGEEEHG